MIVLLTAEGGILGPISKLFGFLMNGIYLGLEKIGIGNIGLAIIIFTLITRILLHPFTIQQQKSSKLMAIIQPEIKAIQKKYEGKTDQQSMMQQQTEIKQVYEKYGTSMTGSCVQLLIQMPIIFALYRVIMNVPAYVGVIKEHYLNIVESIGGVNAIPQLTSFFNEHAKEIRGTSLKQLHEFGMEAGKVTYSIDQKKNFIIDFLSKLNPDQMKLLSSDMTVGAQETIAREMEYLNKANSFCGLNLATAPSAYGIFSPYLVVPILAGLAQYASVFIMQKQQQNKPKPGAEEDQMAATMKSMNIMMPLMSVVFCWGFATGIGVYWIASSIFMVISQLIVNSQLKNLDVDELIKKNMEKVNAKRAKKGLAPLNVEKVADTIKRMEAQSAEVDKKREEKVAGQIKKTEDATRFYFDSEDPNSLFAKANMVQKYNEKNNK